MPPTSDPDKRTAILAAAVEAFTESGFDRTSVAQIVKRAGVAQGTFYLYFESKGHLVPAIASFIIEQFLQRLQSVPEESVSNPDSLLTTLIDVTFAITKEQQQLIAFCYSGMAHFGHASQWEQIYAPYYQWIRQRLEALQKDGLVHPELDPVYTANFLVGVLEHTAEDHYLFGADPEQTDRVRTELWRFLRRAIQP